jgi:hypothetical protein
MYGATLLEIQYVKDRTGLEKHYSTNYVFLITFTSSFLQVFVSSLVLGAFKVLEVATHDFSRVHSSYQATFAYCAKKHLVYYQCNRLFFSNSLTISTIKM